VQILSRKVDIHTAYIPNREGSLPKTYGWATNPFNERMTTYNYN
jgi:hypothetical protein